MNGNSVRPRWRVLDLILILVIGLLVIEAKAHLSSLGHQFAEVAILVVWLVLTWVWLQANASAISQEQWQKSRRTYRIVPGRITVYRSDARMASQTSALAHPVGGFLGNDQAPTAQRDNAVDTLDPASAAPENMVPTSPPDTKETAPRGLSERSI